MKGIDKWIKIAQYVSNYKNLRNLIVGFVLGTCAQVALSDTYLKIKCYLSVVDVSNYKDNGKTTRNTTFEIAASDDDQKILILANDRDFVSVMTENISGRDPYVENSSARNRWQLNSNPPRDSDGLLRTTFISIDRNTGNLSYKDYHSMKGLYGIREANGPCEKVDSAQKKF